MRSLRSEAGESRLVVDLDAGLATASSSAEVATSAVAPVATTAAATMLSSAGMVSAFSAVSTISAVVVASFASFATFTAVAAVAAMVMASFAAVSAFTTFATVTTLAAVAATMMASFAAISTFAKVAAFAEISAVSIVTTATASSSSGASLRARLLRAHGLTVQFEECLLLLLALSLGFAACAGEELFLFFGASESGPLVELLRRSLVGTASREFTAELHLLLGLFGEVVVVGLGGSLWLGLFGEFIDDFAAGAFSVGDKALFSSSGLAFLLVGFGDGFAGLFVGPFVPSGIAAPPARYLLLVVADQDGQ